MKICKNVIFGSFDLQGYIGNYEKFVCFLKKVISGKIVVTSRSLKKDQDHQKPTSFDPLNVMKKLLSRNLTLTRRCEVNKFNLVKYFSL